MLYPTISPAWMFCWGKVPWKGPVPAPGASNVMICAFVCGNATNARQVEKIKSGMLMRLIAPSMGESVLNYSHEEIVKGLLASGVCVSSCGNCSSERREKL